jgi:hypothetical protein
MISDKSPKDQGRLPRNVAITDFKAAMAHFVANSCHTPSKGHGAGGSAWEPSHAGRRDGDAASIEERWSN